MDDGARLSFILHSQIWHKAREDTTQRVEEQHHLFFAPNNVLVVTAINQRIDLAAVIAAKQNSTLYAFAKEQIACLGD